MYVLSNPQLLEARILKKSANHHCDRKQTLKHPLNPLYKRQTNTIEQPNHSTPKILHALRIVHKHNKSPSFKRPKRNSQAGIFDSPFTPAFTSSFLSKRTSFTRPDSLGGRRLCRSGGFDSGSYVFLFKLLLFF